MSDIDSALTEPATPSVIANTANAVLKTLIFSPPFFDFLWIFMNRDFATAVPMRASMASWPFLLSFWAWQQDEQEKSRKALRHQTVSAPSHRVY
ncbi:MAG: hypothetical protein ACREQK_06455, partial [Candidatus Binatia bacterium]